MAESFRLFSEGLRRTIKASSAARREVFPERDFTFQPSAGRLPVRDLTGPSFRSSQQAAGYGVLRTQYASYVDFGYGPLNRSIRSHDANISESLDRSSETWEDTCTGNTGSPEQERFSNMPRRRNRQACECGCGNMTETGRFLRGHATRRRWELIKAAEMGQGTTVRLADGVSVMGTVDDVRNELDARKWSMPASRRSFGVEFELTSPVAASEIVAALTRAGINAVSNRWSSESAPSTWTVKTDGSIRARSPRMGFEVVSPVLRGKRGETAVRKVLEVLNALGCDVNQSTGTHVHIGAADLSVDGVRRVVREYTNAQHAISGIMAPSRRNNNYCRPWNDTELRRMEGCSRIVDMSYVVDRYKTVNLKAYPRIGTVEFRQHGGTLNATKILSWVNVLRKLVESAAKSAVGTERTTTTLPQLLTAIKVDSATNAYMLGRAA